MSCEGCLVTIKGQNRQKETVIQEAKNYAVQNNQTVAVYKEGNEYFFIEAGEAIRSGFPVLEFISQFNRNTP